MLPVLSGAAMVFTAFLEPKLCKLSKREAVRRSVTAVKAFLLEKYRGLVKLLFNALLRPTWLRLPCHRISDLIMVCIIPVAYSDKV